jgi:hypothetical protein
MSSRFYSKRLRVIIEKKEGAKRSTSRPKSFKTEDAAKKWAEANKIKSYELKNLKNEKSKVKKIIVVKK